MDSSNPLQLRDAAAHLTRQLGTLNSHCRAVGSEPQHEALFAPGYLECMIECVNGASSFGDTVDAAVRMPIALSGLPVGHAICSLVLETGLVDAILTLLNTILPLLQSTTNNTGPGGGRSSPAAVAAAAAAAASTADLRAAAEQQRSGGSRSIIGWEWRSDIQTCLSSPLMLLAALQQAVYAAGPTGLSHMLVLKLFGDGFLFRLCDVANNRALMHHLYTKVMGHKPANSISPGMFLEVSNAGLRALHLVLTLPPHDQIQTLRTLPPRFLDTVCRVCANSLDPALAETQATFRAITLLATCDEANSIAKALRYAQQHDTALAAVLAVSLSTPCMQRITHLSLAYFIPRSAVARVLSCANDLAAYGLSPSRDGEKQHNLLAIRLVLEGILRRLDDAHAGNVAANSSSSEIRIRLGWVDASTTPSSPHTPAACDAFGRVWGCGSKPEERMLLSPKSTKLSSLIFLLVKLGTWDMDGWGVLCCRVLGALLRTCESNSCNLRMRTELGGAMAAVARLATAAALHVLKQTGPEEAGEADLREGTAFFKSFASKFAPALNERQTPFNHVVGMELPLAGSLRVLVTHMLRVGKFCNESSWRVTGFTGQTLAGDWHVKIKNSTHINWLLTPGALVTLEMHMRVCAFRILYPKNPATKKAGLSGVPMPPDLIPLIYAHRWLLARTWIGMISSSDPQGQGNSGPSVSDQKYIVGVAGKTISITRTLCKLMMVAAGLVSDPQFSCAFGSSQSVEPKSGSASQPGAARQERMQAARYEVAMLAEEIVCGELQQLHRATVQLFTGYGTEEERSPERRTVSKDNPHVRIAPPREPKGRYLAGDLVRKTSLCLTLMLGRCCVLIASGNRRRGWVMPPSSVARINNHTGPHGALKSQELAGLHGRQVQVKALREAGAFPAAECVDRGVTNTFILTMRTGYFALLHPEALVACGFNVTSREAPGVPELSNCGFETLLTLRLQSIGMVMSAAEQIAAYESGTSVLEMEPIAWERYSYTHLTGLAFPGCHNWGCSNLIGFNEAVLPTLLCGGCKRARYCSVRCQQAAWKVGGHNGVCAELAIKGNVPANNQSSATAAQKQTVAQEKAEEKSMFDSSMKDFARAMRNMVSIAGSVIPHGESPDGSSSSQSGFGVVPRVAPPAEGPGSLARGFFAPRADAAATASTAATSATHFPSASSSRSNISGLQISPNDDSSSSSSGKRLKGGFFDKQAPASTASKQRPTTASASAPKTGSLFGFSFGASSTATTPSRTASASVSASSKQPSSTKEQAATPAATATVTVGSNTSERPVVVVTSDNLLRLAKLINSVSVPTTFDLGGRVFQNYYTGSCSALNPAGHFDVTVDGTCLRNGTFKMGPDDINKASLRLYGKGVVLEDVRVFGGYGIQVVTDAEVTLLRCWVRNALEGICTMTNFGHEYIPRKKGSPEGITRLTAYDTKVTDCRVCGIRVERCSEVDLFDCEFSRNISGITVCGNNLSRVRAKGVRCIGNTGRGVRIGLGCDVVLTECELTSNAGGPMDVNGEGTRLVLAGCLFDGQVVSSNGGKVEVRGREFGKLASAKVCAATWP